MKEVQGAGFHGVLNYRRGGPPGATGPASPEQALGCAARPTEVLWRLQDVLKQLPKLLQDPATAWNSLAVRYERPYVDRLWRPLKDYWSARVFLHRIHPCEDYEALMHPHPWPSAMYLVNGTYEMVMGFGDPTGDHSNPRAAPQPAAVFRLGAGSFYEMGHPWSWHSVRPIGGPTLSVMVTELPWAKESDKYPGKGIEHGTLSAEAQEALLDEFRQAFHVEKPFHMEKP